MKREREGGREGMGNWKTGEQEMARSAADGERGGACGFHFRYETISADGKRELRLARFVARLTAFKAAYFNTMRVLRWH